MDGFPERITYVDDDQKLRQLVRIAFERSDYKTIFSACGNGQELINRIRELQPSLILLDMIMPDMNGPDMLYKLRHHDDAKDIPVIFVTGRDRLVMEQQYKTLGVIGVIHKPFEAKKLPDKVLELWCAHHDINYQAPELFPAEAPEQGGDGLSSTV